MAAKGRTKKEAFPEIKKKNEGKFTNWVKEKYARQVYLFSRISSYEEYK